MATQQIVVLGGSYAGTAIAHYTLKHIIPKLPAPDTYRVIIVSPSREIIVRPAFPRAFLSDKYFDQAKLWTNLEQPFAQYGTRFQFIHGAATHLDHEARTVTVRQRPTGEVTVVYHALVIATGSSTPSPLLSSNGGRRDEGLRHSAGAADESWAGGREFSRQGGRQGRQGRQCGLGIAPTRGAGRRADRKDGGETQRRNTQEADLYIPAYGTRPDTAFVADALRGLDGRVRTNPQTLRVDQAGERVYAVGDASDYARPAVHIILEAIPVPAANLTRDLLQAAGTAPSGVDRRLTADEGETQLVPIGRAKGVGAFKGIKLPSFLVWLFKGRDYFVGMTGGMWSGQQWAKET